MSTVPHLLTTDLNRLDADSRAVLGDHGQEGVVELEEIVSKALHLRIRLDQRHELWAGPIRDGSRPFDMSEAKLWQAAYQQWADDARRIITQAKACETRGSRVAQLETLRDSLARCDYDGLDIQRLARSAENLQTGGGIPASEIRDEIQRRLRA